MSAYNAFLRQEHCSRCGLTSELEYQFKLYGADGMVGYRLGDQIVPGIPRDRKLRYLDLGPGACPHCGNELPWGILIIRKDVMESIYTFPELPDKFYFQFHGIKVWESMLLIEEFSAQRLIESYERTHQRLGKRELTYINSAEGAEESRGALLAALSNPEYFEPETMTNSVRHSSSCATCTAHNDWSIPFKYGPVNGYAYELGSTIDWGKPGRRMDVRDRELRYVTVSMPPCVNCAYSAIGIVTVENEKISDVFVWSKGLMKLIHELPYQVNEMPLLDHFLVAREFGSDVYKLSIEQRNDAVRREYQHPGQSLLEGRIKGVPEDIRDSKIIYRFYDHLKENYRMLRGREYIE